MKSAKKTVKNCGNGHVLLENCFGREYFTLMQIPDNIELNSYQKKKLIALIKERNHFDIKKFIKELDH